jgi:hypothetical protein
MTLRSVACAWCNGELKVPAPDVGSDGYFSLPRACRHCAGQNVVELVGTTAHAVKRRRSRRRNTVTQKIRIALHG